MGADPISIGEIMLGKFGYPADKIRWYRGGMQDREILALSPAKVK